MKRIEKRWADMLRMDALIEGARPPLREVEFHVTEVGLCHVGVNVDKGGEETRRMLFPGDHEFVAAYDCAPRRLKEHRTGKRAAAEVFRRIREIPGLPAPADQGLCHAFWPELALWLSVGSDGVLRMRRGSYVDSKGVPRQEPMQVATPDDVFEAARSLTDAT